MFKIVAKGKQGTGKSWVLQEVIGPALTAAGVEWYEKRDVDHTLVVTSDLQDMEFYKKIVAEFSSKHAK